MPPQRRKCASCRYFQSNNLNGNGWCTHPERQTSSDVRLLVRKDELACRNSWGNDLWVSATGEQPVAAPASETDTSTQLPIAMQRRDDEVTSVVHRDAPARRDPQDVVERDDIMVVEASLVPELRATGEEALGNAAAHADQEHRARILARGGNHSAILDARDRIAARRSPQAASSADTSAEAPQGDLPPVASDDAPKTTGESKNAESGDTETIDLASTPVEAPIRPLTPRPYGLRGRFLPATQHDEDGVENADAPANDEQDAYNSVPAVDPSIELPLMDASDRANVQPEPTPSPMNASVSDTEPVTVYDAVLERARAIRTAAGKETPETPTPDRVRAEELAREEKRARRRITTMPPATVPVTPAPAPMPTIPAMPVTAPVAPRRPEFHREPTSPAPRPSAETRQHNQPPPRHAAPRMGISIGDLKQEIPSPATAGLDRQPAPEPDTAVAIAPGIDFRRLPIQEQAPERATRPVRSEAQEEHVYHEEPLVADDDPGISAGYHPVEEPFSEPRRRSFGHFRNPWKKDRSSARDQQIMANVREALGDDELLDDRFADVYADESTIEVLPARRPEPIRQLQASPDADDVVANDDMYQDIEVAAPTPLRPTSQRPAPSRESARDQQPAQPSRPNSLYRPVHEDIYRESSPHPSSEPNRLPELPRTSGRIERDNGATVLRVRAESVDAPTFDDAWTSPDAEPVRNQPMRSSRGEPIADAFRPLDTEPVKVGVDEGDRFDPARALRLQTVEATMASVEASPWSFAPPVDLESIDGMEAFRGRLFGAGAAGPQRQTPSRHPNDDLVLDVPPRAEESSSTGRPATPPKDSPLRSANYRAPEPERHLRNVAPVGMPAQTQPTRQAPEQANSIDYREESGAPLGTEAAAPSFDIRDLLSESAEPLELGITIAPDVPRACQTCRDFRPSENGERGFCANTWAFTHRQMVNADDLPCQSTIGCWWLPSDRIWMPEPPVERATHRVDALLPAPRRRQSG
ncbi:MAG: hypothetical protein QM753_01530 [Thermomicrobiales bacterium]